MTDFVVHDEQTAPDAAKAYLAGVNKRLNFVPSLLGILAENPAVLEAYTSVSNALSKAGLSPLEQQIVTITASVENQCHFCVAAHTTTAEAQGLDLDVIRAVREDRPIDDPRLEALRQFTKKIVTDRGFVSDCDVTCFLKSGWDRSAVLAVILGVALKVISNYTNHVAETPLNPAFQKHAWMPKSSVSAALT